MSRYADAHKNPKGPGDARPTALQIVQDEDALGKLQGKVIIVTGGSSGIGIETARALHETGAHVFLAVRDVERGREVAEEIKQTGKSQASVEILKLELDSLASVRACAADFLQRSKTLNILITNAGVMCCPEGTTKDGFETQIGVNHFAHFLLFQLLRDCLLTSSTPDFPSRVVSISSLGHRSSPVLFDDLDLKKQGYEGWAAYGQSKTANIYLANEIERRYGPKGIHATSVHPGGIMTNLGRHLSQESMEFFMSPEMQAWMKSPEQGAATTVWAAIGKEWSKKGGTYLEDCHVSEPAPEMEGLKPTIPGYKPYAYDEGAARRLWKVSNELVGLPEEED